MRTGCAWSSFGFFGVEGGSFSSCFSFVALAVALTEGEPKRSLSRRISETPRAAFVAGGFNRDEPFGVPFGAIGARPFVSMVGVLGALLGGSFRREDTALGTGDPKSDSDGLAMCGEGLH